MRSQPIAQLLNLPTIEAYDPIAVEHHLASLSAECVHLRGRLDRARERQRDAEAHTPTRPASLDHAQVEAIRDELAGEREAHEQAIAAITARADVEVEQVLAEAQAEVDALHGALRQLAPQPAPVAVPLAPKGPARVPAVTIAAERAAPTIDLGRKHGSLAG